MKIQSKLILLLLVALFVASCCPCRSYQKKTRRPLEGTEWQLIQLGGKSIQPKQGTYTITLSLDDNRIAGIGACNRVMGNFTTDAKRALKIGPMASTMMACPGMNEERAFVAALESATHYDMDGPMLLILSNGELRAIFQALK